MCSLGMMSLRNIAKNDLFCDSYTLSALSLAALEESREEDFSPRLRDEVWAREAWVRG